MEFSKYTVQYWTMVKSIGFVPLIFQNSMIKYYLLTWVGKRIKYYCCVVCLLLWFEIENYERKWKAKTEQQSFCFAPTFSDSKSNVFYGIHMNSLLFQAGLPLRCYTFQKLFPLQQLSSYSWYFECPGCEQITIQKCWNIKCPKLSRTRVLIY